MQINKQTVVLDLDDTLIFTFTGKYELFERLKYNANEYLESRIYMLDFVLDGKKQQMWGVVRPHVQQFIEYCFERFDKVIIWSAGCYEYVHHICDLLFQEKKPDKILTMNDCEKNDKGEIKFKPLENLYKDFESLNERNTFIVDDNREVSGKNMSNAIFISGYSVSLNLSATDEEIVLKLIDDSDVRLCELIKWFDNEETKYSNDIRTLEKPFFF